MRAARAIAPGFPAPSVGLICSSGQQGAGTRKAHSISLRRWLTISPGKRAQGTSFQSSIPSDVGSPVRLMAPGSGVRRWLSILSWRGGRNDGGSVRSGLLWLRISSRGPARRCGADWNLSGAHGLSGLPRACQHRRGGLLQHRWPRSELLSAVRRSPSHRAAKGRVRRANFTRGLPPSAPRGVPTLRRRVVN